MEGELRSQEEEIIMTTDGIPEINIMGVTEGMKEVGEVIEEGITFMAAGGILLPREMRGEVEVDTVDMEEVEHVV